MRVVSPVTVMLAILVFNASILLVNQANIFYFKVEPLQHGTFGLNETFVRESLNETQSSISYVNPVYVFGDFIRGLVMFINLTSVILFGLPILLSKLGAPDVISNVVFAIVAFIYFIAIVEFLSGRRVRE